MKNIAYLFLIPVALIAIMAIGTYNGLVAKRTDVQVAGGNIQTALQERLEKIPDLVSTVKAAAAHEEAVFTKVTEARAGLQSAINSGDMTKMANAENQLSESLRSLSVVVENYPTLQTSEQYTTLMDEVSGSANRVHIARNEYNAAAGIYNVAVQTFPSNIFAGIFGFRQAPLFQASDEAVNQTNFVDFGLG